MAMLKRDELTSGPAATGDLNALLGRGSEFEGKLTFEGTVRIDGKFKLSQNRPAQDRASVLDAMDKGGPGERALAEWMRRLGIGGT